MNTKRALLVIPRSLLPTAHPRAQRMCAPARSLRRISTDGADRLITSFGVSNISYISDISYKSYIPQCSSAAVSQRRSAVPAPHLRPNLSGVVDLLRNPNSEPSRAGRVGVAVRQCAALAVRPRAQRHVHAAHPPGIH